MTRKELILADDQVVEHPTTYSSNARLTVRCARCLTTISILLGPYWKRRSKGDWICYECRKPQMAAAAAANPLYADPLYKSKFAELHQNDEYYDRVHNAAVNAKISEGAKLAWQRPEGRRAHMRHRTGEDYSARMAAAGERSWEINREMITVRNCADFLTRANAVHSARFDYSNVEYKDTTTNIIIECARCRHRFPQLPMTHLRGCRCPRCNLSAGQMEIYDWISGWTDARLNDRYQLQPLEIDIYLPAQRVGIEFHGVYWHSYAEPETAQQRLRHQRKALAARAAGIRLLQFYDYEWYGKAEIVHSMIEHAAGKTTNRLAARQTEPGELSDGEARVFFEANHLAGHRCAQHTLCLRDRSGPILAMSVSRAGNECHEIIRMAVRAGWSVPGGVSRLMTHAQRKLGGSLSTFSDLRHSFGGCYQGVGFQGGEVTPPGYFYYKNGVILSRQKCQKHKLSDLLGAEFDPSRSESQNMFTAGYRRCWNAGNLKWTL